MQSASHSRPDGIPPDRTPVDGGPTPVIPDYGGAWIGDILPALAAGRAPHGASPWVADAARHVVLLVDGLGWELYRRFASHLPALDGFEAAPITAVVPSTTASALPSLTTGLTPAAHGMLGDRMRVGGAALNVLRWTVGSGRLPDPAVVQPNRPFPHGPIEVISNAEYEGSGFTIAHLRGVPYHGYEASESIPELVDERLRAGARVVYAYLPDLDRTAHERGFDHDAFGCALELTDRVVAGIRRRLPSDAVLLVTADHGHVVTPRDARVDLHALAGMVSASGGSARMRYLHARPGATRDLMAATQEMVGDRGWVADRPRVVREGWMGPHMTQMVAGRLGDVILAARGTTTFGDPLARHPKYLVTEHSSLTSAEVMVPLLVARGYA